jgi:prefoldin subunit 2
MSESSQTVKAKAKAPSLSDQGVYPLLHTFDVDLTDCDQPEIQQSYIRMQNELQALAGKIGELEQEADEHGYVNRSQLIHFGV